MRSHFYSSFQKMIIGIAGLLLLLLVTACAGVQGVSPNLAGPGTVGPGTPGSPGAAVPGSIAFIGPVQSVNSSSIVVKLPDGQAITASIVTGQTDLSDFNGGLPSQGQIVKITATASTNGSFTATELKATDSSDTADQNVVTYEGVVTSVVGSDHVIHIRVGTQDYTFTLSSSTDLSDFQNNSQSIQSNQTVKVKVQFQGTTPTVIDVSLENSTNDSGNG